MAPAAPPVPVHKFPAGPKLAEIGYYTGPLCAIEDSYEVNHPSTILKPVYTPGHSVDHLAFKLEVDGQLEGIFVGDVILGE